MDLKTAGVVLESDLGSKPGVHAVLLQSEKVALGYGWRWRKTGAISLFLFDYCSITV
jgi:hypothetical protein